MRRSVRRSRYTRGYSAISRRIDLKALFAGSLPDAALCVLYSRYATFARAHHASHSAVRITQGRERAESIGECALPSPLSTRCRETDTSDSAHAPTKLCTNYSTRTFLCHSSISAVRPDSAKFTPSKLVWGM